VVFFGLKNPQQSPILQDQAPSKIEINRWMENKSTDFRKKTKILSAIKKDSSEEESLENMRLAVRSMDTLRSHINKKKLREEVLETLSKDPSNIELASKILTDNTFTRSKFAKDQAIARVYAIELLRFIADGGDKYPLHDTTKTLSEVLSLKKEVSVGEWRDLEDLVEHMIEVKNPTYVVAHLKEFLEDLSFSPRVQETFSNAFFFVLRQTLSRKELDQFFDTFEQIDSHSA